MEMDPFFGRNSGQKRYPSPPAYQPSVMTPAFFSQGLHIPEATTIDSVYPEPRAQFRTVRLADTVSQPIKKSMDVCAALQMTLAVLITLLFFALHAAYAITYAGQPCEENLVLYCSLSAGLLGGNALMCVFVWFLFEKDDLSQFYTCGFFWDRHLWHCPNFSNTRHLSKTFV
jgi:hypothetical protein